ncbi:hypothetical protein LUX57_24635 [Actinomadura madurae]|nr:hypothetical protein [Actinomadura madurae]MCP9967938.1 hypothetical protein [Actinomadura madurae]
MVFAQSILYWASTPKLPLPRTTSARPPVSSSSVAAACAMRDGSRSVTADTDGPRRICEVFAAAAANSSHRSLCHGSSAAYTAWNPSSSASLIEASDSATG